MPTPGYTIGMGNVNTELRYPFNRSISSNDRPVNVLEDNIGRDTYWSRLRNRQTWVMINAITPVGSGFGLGPYNPRSWFPALSNGDVVSFDLQCQGWGGMQALIRVWGAIGGGVVSSTRDYGSGSKAIRHFFIWDGNTFSSNFYYVGKKSNFTGGQQYLRKISWWAPGTGSGPGTIDSTPQPQGGYTYGMYDSQYANNNA